MFGVIDFRDFDFIGDGWQDVSCLGLPAGFYFSIHMELHQASPNMANLCERYLTLSSGLWTGGSSGVTVPRVTTP